MATLAAGLVGFAIGSQDTAVAIGTFIGCLFASDSGGGGGGGGGGAMGPSYGTGNGWDGCFVAGTPVLMADGSLRNIETLEVGDRVMTFDGSPGLVREVYTRQTDHTLELRYLEWRKEGGGALRRVETTEEHLFWIKERNRWLPARELAQGDTLIMANGSEADITEVWRRDEPTTVYSFDVDEYESYYANSVLVRQKCGGAAETEVEERLRAFLNGGGAAKILSLEDKLREGGDGR
jgi:hypothetical protein